MKDFNRVAIMTEKDTVCRGFMFEYIQDNFPYNGWAPVGGAVMEAFENTFGDIKASAGMVREKRETFITAIQAELKTRLGAHMAGHEAFADLTKKIREVLQPHASAATQDRTLMTHTKLGL